MFAKRNHWQLALAVSVSRYRKRKKVRLRGKDRDAATRAKANRAETLTGCKKASEKTPAPFFWWHAHLARDRRAGRPCHASNSRRPEAGVVLLAQLRRDKGRRTKKLRAMTELRQYRRSFPAQWLLRVEHHWDI